MWLLDLYWSSSWFKSRAGYHDFYQTVEWNAETVTARGLLPYPPKCHLISSYDHLLFSFLK